MKTAQYDLMTISQIPTDNYSATGHYHHRNHPITCKGTQIEVQLSLQTHSSLHAQCIKCPNIEDFYNILNRFKVSNATVISVTFTTFSTCFKDLDPDFFQSHKLQTVRSSGSPKGRQAKHHNQNHMHVRKPCKYFCMVNMASRVNHLCVTPIFSKRIKIWPE